MKNITAMLVFLISSSASAAIDSSVSSFCSKNPDEKPNSFLVSYDVESANVIDITRMLNILGSKGQNLSLRMKVVGSSPFHSNSESLEDLLRTKPKFGTLRLSFEVEPETSERLIEGKRAKVLQLLTAISEYKGFRVHCDYRLSATN